MPISKKFKIYQAFFVLGDTVLGLGEYRTFALTGDLQLG